MPKLLATHFVREHGLAYNAADTLLLLSEREAAASKAMEAIQLHHEAECDATGFWVKNGNILFSDQIQE